MRWAVPFRLAICVLFAGLSSAAAAAVQIDFTGTTAHSTIVANGLPLTGNVSFDPTAAAVDYSYSSGGVNTVAYALPGTAAFTVDGQTYNYNLSDILLNDSGVVLFILTGSTDPTNSLYIFRQTSNTALSAIPDAGTLAGFAFLNAQFPNGSTSTIEADLQFGVPELSTWAMMLLGFGGIGLVMRRKTLALA